MSSGSLCYAAPVAVSDTSASRVEAVIRKLREDIFHGRFPPGAPLRELSLARDFSVSQATIREALQRLEHAGLVVRKPNVGSTVTRLSPKDMRERVRLRALLEVLAAQEAAPRMREEHFAELERRLRVLEVAVGSDSYYEAAQADLDFHRYVWQCSGDDVLCRTLELLIIPLFAFVSILRSQGLQRLGAVVEAHEPLIAALRSGNPATIREAFERGATSSYRAFITDGPQQTMAAAFGLLETPVHL